MTACRTTNLFDAYKAKGYTTMLGMGWCPTSYSQIYTRQPDILLPNKFMCSLKGGNLALPSFWYDACLSDGTGRVTASVLDWAAVTIKNIHNAGQRVFSVISPHDGHSVNTWSLATIEKHVVKFFTALSQAGVLDDSVFVLRSDHGLHYENSGFLADVRAAQVQRNIPLIIATKRYPVLQENTHRLTTHGDVFKTLLGIVTNTSGKFPHYLDLAKEFARSQRWEQPVYGSETSFEHHNGGQYWI